MKNIDFPSQTTMIHLSLFYSFILSLLCIGLLYQTTSKDRYAQPVSSKPTIITIHGAGGIGGPYAQYSKDLQTVFKDDADIYYFTYNTQQSVKITTEALDLVLGQINTPVILIGHSQGGFTAFYCSQFCTNKNKIKKIVYLSSPLYGTKFISSSIACLKTLDGLDEIRWNSPLQQQVKDLPRCPNNTECFAYVGNNDPFLDPKETAYIDPQDTFIIPGGHDTTLSLNTIKDFHNKLGF